MHRAVALAVPLLLAPAALAEEGMWPFNDFPAEAVKETYGFAPDDAWLERLRLSSLRLGNGCSASFVSSQGLVMTNHHCVHACVQDLSTRKQDLVGRGFLARKPAQERRCPGLEANQLTAITDVTGRVRAATADRSGEALAEALRAELARIEAACAVADDVRCEVVTLWSGARYELYRYRRYDDVRLVFAPELDIAAFGGDPDNFEFPRWDLDVAFLRLWDGPEPVKTPHWLPWAEEDVSEGDLVFVSGHPGRTSRLLTVAELEYERDHALPGRLLWLAELRGLLHELARRSPEAARISLSLLRGVENGYKGLEGRRRALTDARRLARKAQDERALRARLQADPTLAERYGDPFADVDEALSTLVELDARYLYLEGRHHGAAMGLYSDLFRIARLLVRSAEELNEPNDERLREYGQANRPALEQELFSEAPIHPVLEIATLGYSLRRLREVLGPDDPVVRAVLGKQTPRQAATRYVRGSKLRNVAWRRKLLDGGREAIAASKDPMIRLARLVDPAARAVRARYENEVESKLLSAGERIARAKVELEGTEGYPDATSTLRLSYGTVKGYEAHGARVEPITRFEGLFERYTGQPPFELPPRWLERRRRLDLRTPMNFASTNDIIGGNSGSPVVDRRGRVVGVVFDGNIQSLGGEYWFDPTVNRAVSVHGEAILTALEDVYEARRLLRELRPDRDGDD